MEEKTIKVSVIIPVYQVENFLERAVDSVLEQTLPEKEIILVDDGSPDASPAICDRYARQYPGLIRVIHKENGGLGLARNTGAAMARGEYIAFLDSDDSVEPEMYQQMYETAVEGDFDIVMCDVEIHYVEENRSSVVSTCSHASIDLADYLVHGNNITYSVNKLYKRDIWQNHQYRKMLFEDIALIPALVTHYPRLGYVPRPFYHYYRRANTISTTLSGGMADLVQAFRFFLTDCHPAYRKEAVYCAAKQIYWNMFQSRTLFQADFITLLQEYQTDFLLNPYLEQDRERKKLLDFIGHAVIPDTFFAVHLERELPCGYRDCLQAAFPKARLVERTAWEGEAPPSVRQALQAGNISYAEEYLSLRLVYQEGGIVLAPDMRVNLNLNRLRLHTAFFGFENAEELTAGCFGAQKGNHVIRALLDSYEGESIYNQALLPLSERLRDFLILHFALKPNGRTQSLKHGVQVYLPSVLAYDMQNGENCCKRERFPLPGGYQAVSDAMLKFWSDRLLENWKLYKQEKQANQKGGAKGAAKPSGAQPQAPFGAVTEQELQERIEEVVNRYENSTCWRITRPLRWLAGRFGR